MIGQTVAHYRVTEKIGEGGMGEVYRAHDTKLNRDVALKILPQIFAQDSQRMARFEREAQVLASLNHSHIAQIHGLEETDGTKALVLELVEGETLQELIARGPIPVDEALKLALQICEGLEAAHEKGIIHRDLKPANIKITPEGEVKILDFGLAKALEGETPVSDLSHSPTLTQEATRAGVILGTASYMSPEQARGKPVDQRSDIWAFGCVLYEMLTGRQAYRARTVPDTLAAILAKHPPLGELPEKTSTGIRRLLRRCLTKETHGRLHNIADGRLEIQDLLSGIDDVGGAAPDSQLIFSRRRSIIRVLGGFLGGTLLASVWFLGPWPGGASDFSDQLVRLEMITPERILGEIDSSIPQWRPLLTISRDGKRVVFRAGGEEGMLYQRRLGQDLALAIPGTERATTPTLSPDGTWLAFYADKKLLRVPIDGGTPEILGDAPNPFGLSWNRDETIIFMPEPRYGELWRVSERGGAREKLSTIDFDAGEFNHQYPWSVLPGGKFMLFAVWYGSNRWDGALLNLETGEHEVVVEDTSSIIYSPTGHLLFSRSDGLYAVAFDAEARTKRGPEVPIIRDIYISELTRLAHFGLSKTGTLVYLSGNPRARELVLVDLKGKITPLSAPPRQYEWPRFSPDGREISVIIQEGESYSAWIVDRNTGIPRRLTMVGSTHPVPLWTPEGNHIVFNSDRSDGGRWRLYRKASDGSGKAELFFDPRAEGHEGFDPYNWSRDGKALLGYGRLNPDSRYSGIPGKGGAILYLDLNDSPTLKEVVPGQAEYEKFNPVLSPSGRWVAYVSDESGRREVYISPFPGPGETHLVSIEGGLRPLWSPDGEKLFYFWDSDSAGRTIESFDHTMMVVDIEETPKLKMSEPRVLFKIPAWQGDHYPYANWDISPDGECFVMTREVEGSPQQEGELKVVLNFFKELREKVPTE